MWHPENQTSKTSVPPGMPSPNASATISELVEFVGDCPSRSLELSLCCCILFFCTCAANLRDFPKSPWERDLALDPSGAAEPFWAVVSR